MFPDAKWLDALKLPTKVKFAIVLACGALLYLFKSKTLTLGEWDRYVAPALIIALVVFGVLVVVDVVEWLARPITAKRHVSMLASRRAIKAQERIEERDATRATIIARLDHLSREEIAYVAGALEKGSSTFYTYVYAGPVGALQAKGLIWSTGGTHNQDHYPFAFQDFVWEALLVRQDEFMAKETAHREEEVRQGRRARVR